MQLRWIAIGVVCFSAALLSACGNAPGGTSARSASAAMSKANSRYDSSDKNKSDDDECDESEHSDKSSDKSRSLMSSKSKDDDSDECKESEDEHHKSSGHSYSKSMSVDSHSSSKDGKDHDKDDDDTCKVTICHVPGVNKCKPHKMRVGKSDLQAHIEHGDYPGACDPAPVDPGPVNPPPVDPGPVNPPPPACFPNGSVCNANSDCCTGTCGFDPITLGVVCGGVG